MNKLPSQGPSFVPLSLQPMVVLFTTHFKHESRANMTPFPSPKYRGFLAEYSMGSRYPFNFCRSLYLVLNLILPEQAHAQYGVSHFILTCKAYLPIIPL